MGWFFNNDKDASEIQSKIRDLEREYDYLQSQISDAKKKWWEHRFVNADMEEAEYWRRLEDKYIDKQYYVREKIRNLEAKL